MVSSLPPAPSLEYLKKQAKNLLKQHRSGDRKALPLLKHLHRFAHAEEVDIFSSHLQLNEAQLAIAIDYEFPTWANLKKYVLGRTGTDILHIHCGDSSAGSLRESSVSGEVLVWHEIYIEGPVPGNVTTDEFKRIRAEYLSSAMNMNFKSLMQGTDTHYTTLAKADKYKEVVLWFDACMFDQTIMIHLLDQCSQLNWPDTKLSLICISKFSGIDNFAGLGQLYPEQMASLFDTRHTVSPAEIKLAHNAWQAFTSDNPLDIEKVINSDCSALPYLKDALVRHLEQFPNVRNGLNRTQNQILQIVADGAEKLIDIFVKTQNMEERPFMGDTSMWSNIVKLSECKQPLLKLDGPGKFSEHLNPNPTQQPIKNIKQWKVSLTKIGKEILNGKQDFIELNGIDRWLGGVHLNGLQSQWRWDEASHIIVNYTHSKN